MWFPIQITIPDCIPQFAEILCQLSEVYYKVQFVDAHFYPCFVINRKYL